MNNLIADLSNIDLDVVINFFRAPSLKGLQLAIVIYIGLLWLSVIIWVTRDSINRSDSIIFQAFSIILNIAFPILGIFLYMIIRPNKTISERYYEELEHKLILDNIDKKESNENYKVEPKKTIKIKQVSKKTPAKKTTRKKVSKK